MIDGTVADPTEFGSRLRRWRGAFLSGLAVGLLTACGTPVAETSLGLSTDPVQTDPVEAEGSAALPLGNLVDRERLDELHDLVTEFAPDRRAETAATGAGTAGLPARVRVVPIPASIQDDYLRSMTAMYAATSGEAGIREESADEGWPEDADVHVADRRPHFFQVSMIVGDVHLDFMAQHPETMDELYEWSRSVADRVSADRR